MAYIYYNPNPKGNYVGDCVIRAISKLLDNSWDKTYLDLCVEGFNLCDMPSSNVVWASYLLKNGCKKGLIPDNCPNCYTIQDFCRDTNKGKYLLATGTHVVTVIDGNYYDSWDSGDEVPIYLFKKED